MAVALVAAALMGGCDDADDERSSADAAANIVQAGAPGEPSRRLSPDEAAQIEVPKHSRADVDFMKAMIHHHGQALLMTAWVPRRSSIDDVPLMAKRMQLSQETEIEQMQRWLKERGEEAPEPGDHQGHDHGSRATLPPGMLTSAQLGRLYTAKGRGFDRLFLRYMIFHHEGALKMVDQLVAQNGAAEPEISAFTSHVEADQGIEISRMRRLLERL